MVFWEEQFSHEMFFSNTNDKEDSLNIINQVNGYMLYYVHFFIDIIQNFTTVLDFIS